MLPFLLCVPPANAYQQVLTGVQVFPSQGPQNVQPLVSVHGEYPAQQVWLSDPRGELVPCEKRLVQGLEQSWIRLIPTAPLEPGSYAIHGPSGMQPLQVQAGLDQSAPHGGARFGVQPYATAYPELSVQPEGAWATDESPVLLQLQLLPQRDARRDPEQVDTMGVWMAGLYEAKDAPFMRLRWMDAAGNVTSWTEPLSTQRLWPDTQARVERMLRGIGPATFTLVLGLLGALLTAIRPQVPHRSPVGFRRPISPGPRTRP